MLHYSIFGPHWHYFALIGIYRTAYGILYVDMRTQEVTGEQADMRPNPQKWLTTAEVAERLGLKQTTISAWFRSGKLPGHKLPGHAGWRINELELDRWMRSQPSSSPRAQEAELEQ
jgi:excisionase family DNA binding protein